MTTLVAYGTTPTGVGIVQLATGRLRPTSPCCGMFMEYDREAEKVLCKHCGGDLQILARSVVPYSITGEVIPTIHSDSLSSWLRAILGVEVEVEVKE